MANAKVSSTQPSFTKRNPSHRNSRSADQRERHSDYERIAHKTSNTRPVCALKDTRPRVPVVEKYREVSGSSGGVSRQVTYWEPQTPQALPDGIKTVWASGPGAQNVSFGLEPDRQGHLDNPKDVLVDVTPAAYESCGLKEVHGSTCGQHFHRDPGKVPFKRLCSRCEPRVERSVVVVLPEERSPIRPTEGPAFTAVHALWQ